jgi:hypothetical protein
MSATLVAPVASSETAEIYRDLILAPAAVGTSSTRAVVLTLTSVILTHQIRVASLGPAPIRSVHIRVNAEVVSSLVVVHVSISTSAISLRRILVGPLARAPIISDPIFVTVIAGTRSQKVPAWISTSVPEELLVVPMDRARIGPELILVRVTLGISSQVVLVLPSMCPNQERSLFVPAVIN